MRIAIFGDSFVNGTGDDACLGWPGRLGAAARRGGHDVTLYNLGVRRDTSADILARWRREAEPRLPDGVEGRLVFSFGANDCAPAGGADSAGGPRVPHGQALANAEAILREAAAWRPTLMVGPLPVSDDPGTDARVATLSGDLAALCRGTGVPYLEVFTAMAACPVWAAEAAAGDGTHPNGGGYAALAGRIAAWDAWASWFPGPGVQPRFR